MSYYFNQDYFCCVCEHLEWVPRYPEGILLKANFLVFHGERMPLKRLWYTLNPSTTQSLFFVPIQFVNQCKEQGRHSEDFPCREWEISARKSAPNLGLAWQAFLIRCASKNLCFKYQKTPSCLTQMIGLGRCSLPSVLKEFIRWEWSLWEGVWSNRCSSGANSVLGNFFFS